MRLSILGCRGMWSWLWRASIVSAWIMALDARLQWLSLGGRANLHPSKVLISIWYLAFLGQPSSSKVLISVWYLALLACICIACWGTCGSLLWQNVSSMRCKLLCHHVHYVNWKHDKVGMTYVYGVVVIIYQGRPTEDKSSSHSVCPWSRKCDCEHCM
jgi:hypothetical protein